jgi:hypothetical protein
VVHGSGSDGAEVLARFGGGTLQLQAVGLQLWSEEHGGQFGSDEGDDH